MDENELLDQQNTESRKEFNKSPFLYGFVSLCLLGFLIRRMHWPGGSITIIVGGGLSVGYILALLTQFVQHYLFENIGFLVYIAFISFSVFTYFNPMGWTVYGGTLLATFFVFFFVLREKEIV